MIIRVSILLIAFLFAVFQAYTQEKSDTTLILKPVNIIAKKPIQDKAIIKTTIDTSIIQETIDASLSKLLSSHSPVFIKTYGQGSLATASFRGTASSHTQVEWNGININSPMIGQVDFSLIPVYFIDEVELFHGGSSLQNGSGALGGSIHVNSRPSWDTTFNTTLIQSFASFNTYQSFIKLKGGKKNICYDLRAYHEQSENDFEFYNNANGLWNYENQKNANYTKDGVLFNSWFNIKSSNIVSVHFWGQLTDRNLPAIMSYQGSGREENQQDIEFRAAAKWKKYGVKYKSELSSGFTKTNLDYYLANKTPLGLFINYDSESSIKSVYNKYMFEYKLKSKTLITVLLNYNHHKASIFNKKESSGFDKTRNEIGTSLNLRHDFTKRFSAFGLVRYDYVDNKNTPIMPSVGIEYQILKKSPLNFTANYTRNYHQPSLNDLYWLPGGNPDLKPEEGYTGDIAISYEIATDSGIHIKTSLGSYMSHISDWIIWRPGEFRYWQADNIKNVYARGFEYSITAKGLKKKLNWGIFANFTYTKTTNEEEISNGDNSVGKQLIYIPLYKGNFMSELSYKGYIVNYNIAYTGERFTTTSNETTRHSLPGYYLHDISVGKKMNLFKKKSEIQFKVNNINNIDYQAILWRAMPGRNYKLLIKFKF